MQVQLSLNCIIRLNTWLSDVPDYVTITHPGDNQVV